MAENECLQAASHHRIRHRLDHELDECVLVLAAVHEQDGYPLNGPDAPHSWLARPPYSPHGSPSRTVGSLAMSGSLEVRSTMWHWLPGVPFRARALKGLP